LTNKGLCVKIFNCVEPHSTTAQKRCLTVMTLMASLRLLKEENMKAVIETGGKQYYVEEGTVLYVEKLDVEEGKEVTFDKVLMVNGKAGSPYVKGAKVVASVVRQGKAKKVVVYKYNPKKNYHKTQGHRQPYTKVEIKSIIEK